MTIQLKVESTLPEIWLDCLTLSGENALPEARLDHLTQPLVEGAQQTSCSWEVAGAHVANPVGRAGSPDPQVEGT